ncbi:hypothetical protein M139_4915, partial [Bacteroides fragilis str. S23L24]
MRQYIFLKRGGAALRELQVGIPRPLGRGVRGDGDARHRQVAPAVLACQMQALGYLLQLGVVVCQRGGNRGGARQVGDVGGAFLRTALHDFARGLEEGDIGQYAAPAYL